MADKELEDTILKGLEYAERKGLGHAELYLVRSRSLSIKVRKGELDEFQNARSTGLGVRVIKGHRCGYSYTEDVSEPAVLSALERASEIASFSPADEHYSMAGPEGAYPQLELVSRDIEDSPVSVKIAMAGELESAARGVDKRIVNVPEAYYGDGYQEVTIFNSLGLRHSYIRNGAGLSISLMAKEGEEVKSPSKYKYACRLSELNARKLAEEAAREGLSRLGARAVASKMVPVVFNNEAARELLGAFSGMFSARNVQKGLSLLRGRIGQELGAKVVTLRDNALLPDGPASRPFDDEGTASQDTLLVERGVLKSFLQNRYTAAIDGLRSTGNASRRSIKEPLEVAASNFYLVPGQGSVQGLMEEAREGILVVDLQGVHSGTSAVSGDFSLGAQGYYFEGGRISYPVHNFTVAGNFLAMLKDVVAVAGDLEFTHPHGSTSIGSPSFLVSELAISGEGTAKS